MGKHRVIVERRQCDGYLENGYSVSALSVKDVFGASAQNLQGQDMVVMEIGEAKHEKLSQLPRAYRIVGFNSTRIDRQYRMEQVEVMERNRYDCYISALPDGSAPGSGFAECVRPDSIYDSRRECAEAEASGLRERVRLLREAAANIEKFMVRIECPPAGEKQ